MTVVLLVVACFALVVVVMWRTKDWAGLITASLLLLWFGSGYIAISASHATYLHETKGMRASELADRIEKTAFDICLLNGPFCLYSCLQAEGAQFFRNGLAVPGSSRK